jgi:hypothetical protein
MEMNEWHPAIIISKQACITASACTFCSRNDNRLERFSGRKIRVIEIVREDWPGHWKGSWPTCWVEWHPEDVPEEYKGKSLGICRHYLLMD